MNNLKTFFLRNKYRLAFTRLKNEVEIQCKEEQLLLMVVLVRLNGVE